MKQKKSEKGQGMTEYIIIVAVIAIAALAGFKMFGTHIKESVNTTGKALEGVSDQVESDLKEQP